MTNKILDSYLVTSGITIIHNPNSETVFPVGAVKIFLTHCRILILRDEQSYISFCSQILQRFLVVSIICYQNNGSWWRWKIFVLLRVQQIFDSIIRYLGFSRLFFFLVKCLIVFKTQIKVEAKLALASESALTLADRGK